MVDRLGLAPACRQRFCADHDPHRPQRTPAREWERYGRRAVKARARGLPRPYAELCANGRGSWFAVGGVIVPGARNAGWKGRVDVISYPVRRPDIEGEMT